MIKRIKKRDGKIVSFDKSKITEAIWKAAQAVGGKERLVAEKLSDEVVKQVEERFKGRIPSVEDIQDIVEKVLIENGHSITAKAYILYRRQHEEIRNLKSLFKNISIIENYLNLDDWRIKENSNMTYSLQGLNNHISSVVVSEYWLEKIYPTEIRNAHKNGDFHIHDLSVLGPYCVGWDLKDLLMVGFKGVEGKVASRPAKHFKTALGQVVNFFYTLQGESAGAQAFSNFDTLLAPFIKYDNLSYEEVKQAMQEFIYNMNVPTRVGFQTPFTNITMDMEIPSFMKNEHIVIGGELKNETYGEFSNEIAMFNKAFAEVMLEGDANGRVFTFPIPTYNITKDFDFDNPKYDDIWRMTAKYGIPYFSNFVNSDMKPEDARSMCCRLRLDNRELRKRGGGLFGSNPLTGSIGVVTINLPRIGYLSNNEDEFFERLSELMDIAKRSLEIKRKVLETQTERGLYPYSKYYLRTIKTAFGQYWKNHFSTIGLIGMNEACLNLFGENLASKTGQDFAIRVMDFMREKIGQYQEETNNLYNLEATPAEGTSYRLAMIDKKMYPDIIVANEENFKKGARPYYTNSTQLSVDYTDDLFEALNLQDELQIRYTGGTVFHTYLGESMPPIKSIKELVKKISFNFKLPYFTITPVFSICPTHGYIFGKHEKCPKCGADCEVYSRVVGYIRPIQQWNDGKKSEFYDRKLFDSSMEAEVNT